MKSLLLLSLLTLTFSTPNARADDGALGDGDEARLENTGGWKSCKPECTGVVRRGGRTLTPWCAEFSCGQAPSCWASESEARNRCGNEA